MPRLIHRSPSYRKHRASRQALVTIDGRDIYLGPFGTAASRREYDRIIGEWLAGGRQARPTSEEGLRVIELIARFWKHARTYYVSDSGHGGELASFKLALQHLKRLYGDTPINSFAPLALKSVRVSMVDAGWSRVYVNRQISRIRQVFKWGVAEEIVSPEVWHGLQCVAGLKAGKSDAPETEPVRPVPEGRIVATRECLPPNIRSMMDLQLLTGMRPGEVCAMRTRDIDTTGKLWTYKPERHKTQHHGHQRTVYIGPKAQAVLGPLLRVDLEAYIFSPAEADLWYREERAKARTTPPNCGNRQGTNIQRRPRKKPGKRFTTDTYAGAIEAACKRAFPPPPHLERGKVRGARGEKDLRFETEKEWKARLGEALWAELEEWQGDHRWSPNQLRHNAGTQLRKEFGLEAAQVILGHRTLTVTQVYAEKNVAAAQKIMEAVG